MKFPSERSCCGLIRAITRLNGDQTNQGRQLLMDPHRPHLYRVRLYSLIPEGRH
jgi:hypothetical protein